jgi:predicted alpha-1,2-mannosidase
VSPYDAVNPFIGTAADGNTFPAATLPFGMMQWGPDTRAGGRYNYADKSIRGLSLTHISGAGCPLYADVPVLPWTAEIADSTSLPDTYTLAFSHNNEQAHPGYYAVQFDNGVKAELTTAMRAGIGRFTFPADANHTLLFKAGSSATIEDPKRRSDTSSVEIRGRDTVAGTVHSGGFCSSDSNYILYFAVKFTDQFSSFGTWDTALHDGARSVTGHKAGAWVTFANGSKPLVVKIGISFVSVDNALANLKAEIQGWDFGAVYAAAKFRWSYTLGRVRTEGGTPEQRTIFYTGLYHMLLSPNLFNDASGDYIGFDGKVRRLHAGEKQYANFSDWDTYRNVVQLHALLFPDETSQMMQSLVRDAEQSGWLPRWPAANDVTYVMNGDSSAVLLSSAYAFGARDFDSKLALRYMLKGATQFAKGPHDGYERPYLEEYLKRGYVPVASHVLESGASITLEYATADFAVSRLAAAHGDRESAARLLRSAQNWRTMFDKESNFIRPRTADGKFLEGWDPDRLLPHRTGWDHDYQLGFEEGSTWQYSFMIPHNYAGLFGEMGGAGKAAEKLDRFFEKLSGWGLPNFTVTNEPDFCAIYAYLWAGLPWKTQAVIDRVRRETFFNTPDGLPGNDDLGATSGVYVWNAIGMYPVIPGVGGFALGTPMFPRTLVTLGNGRTLEIVSRGEGIYVDGVKLNAKRYDRSWLPLDALSAKHNRLEFNLRNEPSKMWAAQPDAFPPSFDLPR